MFFSLEGCVLPVGPVVFWSLEDKVDRLSDRSVCDTALAHFAGSLSINEFSDVLGLVREALKKGLASNDETRAALHFSSVLVGNAPEGTELQFIG